MGGLLHLVHRGEEGTGLGCPAAYSSFQAYSAYSTILDTLNEVWQISILAYSRNVASQQKINTANLLYEINELSSLRCALMFVIIKNN